MFLGIFRWGVPSFIFAAFSLGSGGRLVDYPSLCSIFATTGNTAEDISYPVEHYWASWEWCGVPSIPSPTSGWRFSVGTNSSGPLWGRIVDSRGPRILLACSFVFLLSGYSGIKYLYDSGLAPDASSAPAIVFYALIFCSFLTGIGSSGGFASSVNSTAKTFPDRAVCILWRWCKAFITHYFMTASIHDWSGNIWLWTIGLSFLNYISYALRW